MDNVTIARMLEETADLLEIDAGDPFRIRSYRRAAEAIDQQTVQVETLATKDADPKALLAIPGIGKGMAANIRDIVATRTFPLHDELLERYKPSILELLRLPGMGPKTVALLFSALGIADVDALEEAAKRGDLLHLPRMGQKFTDKLLKGIEDFRKNSSRFRIDIAKDAAERIRAWIGAFPGIETVTPAGSLRRGRETVGDLDLLVTGPACEPDVVAAAAQHVASLPLMEKLLAKGQNKVSFTVHKGLQVDVRLLPRSSYGAALQYFTGSKMHNVALRQRALKRGLTLSEYALLRLEDNVVVASRSEQEIYHALGLDFIPPELRENNGELEAAESHTLPRLIERSEVRGDLHMHTTESDGHNSIREMAEAAIERGLDYIAITDHSKNLAMTHGMDDERAVAHARRIRQVSRELSEEFAAGRGPQWERYKRLLRDHESQMHTSVQPEQEARKPTAAFRILAGVEVDILLDGTLDLSDETLAGLDIVIASVHSGFNQTDEQITARVLRAIENPHVHILGHPTGRKVLGREPYKIDVSRVLKSCAREGVAVEHNSQPERSDLSDLNLRLARQLGCKIVVNTDAHATAQLDHLAAGVVQLRRAWLRAADVLNTRPVDPLLAALRRAPETLAGKE
ncbi:MAG: PHP domain-containing protein [Acidobacteriaceae bacterium]